MFVNLQVHFPSNRCSAIKNLFFVLHNLGVGFRFTAIPFITTIFLTL